MFMFKSLYDKVVSPTPAKAELATIDGCFFLVRPTVTVKGAKECIFQTAIASIRRTSQSHQYELVVCRSATEEEAELLEDEDAENIDEYVSLIDPHMDFKIQPANETDSEKPGAMALTWLDLAGGEEDSFLFVVEGAAKGEISAFELIMYRCMWEREHNADAKDVKDAELLTYRLAIAQPIPSTIATPAKPSKAEATPKKSQKPLFRAPSPSSSDDDVADELTAQVARLNVSTNERTSSPPVKSTPSRATSSTTTTPSKGKGKAKEESPAPVMYPVIPAADEEEIRLPAVAASPVRVKKEEPEPAPPIEEEEAGPTQEDITNATYDPPDDRKLLISEECDLNLFDKATGMFMLQEANVVSSLWLVKGKTFSCWLSIAGKDGFIWVSTPVDADLPLHFEEQHTSIIISFVNKKNQQNFTWLMRYNSSDVYLKMNHAFTQGIFEANNGAGTWSRLKPDEQKYNTAAYEIGDVEMEPWNPEEDEDYAEEDERRQEDATVGDRFGEEELYSDEEEETEESEDEEDEPQRGKKKTKNSLLTVGYKGMSFVVRGDMIGVFENQKGQGKKLKFMTNIAGIKRPGSKDTFVPNKVMLHDQDQAMILADPMNPNAVYKLDLETGTVTDEWKIGEDIQIRNFMPDSKYAQQQGTQTFVGSSRNAVFRVDPRLGRSKLVDSSYKDYKSPFDFTAGVTTADGKLAFATNKGEIKLFDRLGIRAKTAFAQIGQEISGIDVTADGKYIVATTRDRLLFVDTSIKEGKNSGRTGFDAAIPSGDRPQVHALALRPEHKAYMDGGVNFTPAKFNVGEGLEKTIVTSSGPYIITWNFRAVKSGRFTEYKIKRYDEDIVADNFTWGNDRDIVVTMPNDMRIESKSSLMAPSRQSLSAASLPKPTRRGIRKSKVVQEWDGE